jgi:transcriptional regulator with XRE-family HTH domain
MGGRLGRAREASGLTAREVAWRLGIRISTVNSWESDRAQPGASRLTMLAGVFGVSLSWLLHGIGTGPSEDDDNPDPKLDGQLDRLKSLHVETGALIARIESQIGRMRIGEAVHASN